MGWKRIDITGQSFGRYTVLEFAYSNNGRAYWHCKCDCGQVKDIRGTSLRIGQTKSCGCLQKEISIKINSGSGHPFFGKKRPEHSKKMLGKKHFNYNFNLTDEEREINRRFPKYIKWRIDVFERDAYTCQCCSTKKGPFNAHHLNSYNKFKKLRTVLSNGVTLCEKCHKEFHRLYGRGNNIEKQFKEFINKELWNDN